MTPSVVCETLGLVAGALVCFSTMPKLLERLTTLRSSANAFNRADLKRDLMQAAGNGLWVVVGVLSGLLSIILFCGLSTVLLVALISLNLRACRNGKREPRHALDA